MNPYIKNPKILLLKCSIEYLYREETKFTCIDPIVLQVSEEISCNVALLLLYVKKQFFVCFSGAGILEELRAAHRRRPSNPGVGGEDRVTDCSGHAVRARHHAGHQRQTGQWDAGIDIQIEDFMYS